MTPTCCKEDPELERFRKEELPATAYHEAGHAVLHSLWDLPFERVEVFTDEHPAPPDLKGRYAGIVRSDSIANYPDWAMPWEASYRRNDAFKHWERLICISLAGALAEWRHSLNTGCRMAPFTGRLDQKDIRTICQYVIGCPVMSVLKDWIATLKTRTWKLLNQAPVWAAVTAVAEALLDRAVLTRAEVQALVERTCPACPPAVARRSKLPSVRKQVCRHPPRSVDKKQRTDNKGLVLCAVPALRLAR